MTKIKYIRPTDSYNERRYGKPWIATVTFDDKSKANFSFGDWIGDEGYEGQLEVLCNPGDIIALGQKDTRKPANSAPQYFTIDENKKLSEVTKLKAYHHYQKQTEVETPNPLAEFSLEDMQREIDRRQNEL